MRCRFLLLSLVSFLKPRAIRHLFVPGVLLFVATLLCAWLYVFEQNWLLTIIHGELSRVRVRRIPGRGVPVSLRHRAQSRPGDDVIVNGIAHAIGIRRFAGSLLITCGPKGWASSAS